MLRRIKCNNKGYIMLSIVSSGMLNGYNEELMGDGGMNNVQGTISA